jgi:hypothetical protein
MTKKIDPLNKKQYGAVSAMLTISDMTAAVNFYQKALGFSKRHHERPRWQAHPCRTDAAWRNFDARTGESRAGQAQRKFLRPGVTPSAAQISPSAAPRSPPAAPDSKSAHFQLTEGGALSRSLSLLPRLI